MKNVGLYFIFVSFLIISCQKILFNNEDEETRELSFGNFHAVRIYGMYNLVLIQDSSNRMVITGSNDINSIDAIIKNDTLIIDNHKKISFNPNKNKLALYFSNLNFVVTYDPVSISNRDTIRADNFLYEALGKLAEVRMIVDCNNFYFVNSANTLGHFSFIGKATNCWFFNRYGCSIFADSLYCKNIEIVNESVGDVYVSSSESIRAYIWGPGNIYYHGTPVIEVIEKRGDGRVIKGN
jgi:hypothetical protein